MGIQLHLNGKGLIWFHVNVSILFNETEMDGYAWWYMLDEIYEICIYWIKYIDHNASNALIFTNKK